MFKFRTDESKKNVMVSVIWNRNWKWEKPEDEDEETEQSEEGSDIVHCVQHHDQLVTQRRQKSNQFEYPQ